MYDDLLRDLLAVEPGRVRARLHAGRTTRSRGGARSAATEPALEALLDGAELAPRRSLSEYLRAAERGSAHAMYHLSLCYLCGVGVTPDLAASRRWAQACELALHERGQRCD